MAIYQRAMTVFLCVKKSLRSAKIPATIAGLE